MLLDCCNWDCTIRTKSLPFYFFLVVSENRGIFLLMSSLSRPTLVDLLLPEPLLPPLGLGSIVLFLWLQ